MLFAAADHLRAILLLVRGGLLPTFALYSLLRPAATALVRGRHLLEPGITERERFARGLNERLDNLEEQSRLDASLREHYGRRVENLARRAAAEDIQIRHRKDDPDLPIVAFGEPRLKDVDLYQRYLEDGAPLFRYLSGHVHAMQWVQIRPSRVTPTTTPGLSMMPLDLDVVRFASMLTSVLGLFDETVGCWLLLAGYPPDVWSVAKRR